MLNFFFDLPDCILNQIISCFVQLPYVCEMSSSSLICQDGCISLYLNYDASKCMILILEILFKRLSTFIILNNLKCNWS